jgi:hypothetical protein
MSHEASQSAKILEWLESGRPITALDALDHFGCFRLGARIYDLKRDGHEIESRPYKTAGGATIAQYRLIRKPANLTQGELISL